MKLSNDELGIRYSRALLDVASEKNQQKEVMDELNEIDSVFENNPQLGDILTESHLPLSEKQKILDIVKQNASTLTQNFLQLLYDNSRLYAFTDIVAACQKRYDKNTSTCEATVTSAVKLDSDQLASLKKAIAQRLNAKTIVVTTKVDPAIIGGVIVEVGDKVIDGSVKTKIRNLHNALLSNY